MQDLEQAQTDLERHRQLLGGIIATIRVGDFQANEDLVRLIRSGVDLSQLAAHVRNECRSNIETQQAYESIVFVIDGPEELPSPAQLLNRGNLHSDIGRALLDRSRDHESESVSNTSTEYSGYGQYPP